MTVSEFAQHMVTIGMRYGGSCVSWGRSGKRNFAKKGHPDSFHMTWLAADVVFDSRRQAELAWEAATRQGIWCKWNGDVKTSETIHFQALHPRKN